jgi:hypothetical protein
MTVSEILAVAMARGVTVKSEGDDLDIIADRKPDSDLLDVLRDHKEAIVAELSKVAATPGEWPRRFENHAETVRWLRGLARPKAERAAFDIVLIEFLNATLPDTDPNRCVSCRRPETSAATLLPIGSRHVWLHSNCWEAWRARRVAKAEKDLARVGIVKP